MNGWIKIDRRIVNMDGYFGEKFNRTMCWIDLLLLAEWKDERSFFIRGNRVTAKRGQVVMSLKDLGERWGMTRMSVMRKLREFEDDEMISVTHSKVANIITILKYDEYQGEVKSQTKPCKSEIGQKGREKKRVTLCDTPCDTLNVTPDVIPKINTTDSESKEYNDKMKNDVTPDVTPDVTKSAQPIKNNKNNIKENLLTKVKEISSPPGGAEVLGRSEIHFSKIKDLWNNTCLSYSKLITLSEARKNKIRNRIEEMGGEEKAIPILQQVFSNLQESKFLKGDNARGWKANFDWVFNNDKNWVKVYEGNYENRKSDGFNSVPNQTYDGQTAVDKFTTDFAEWINGIPIG